jgi:hypothetical protein
MPRARGWTDDQLRLAVAESTNLFQVCRALGIAPGARTYTLLRRHIARLGLDAAHLPQVERPRRRRTWTDDDLRAAVATNTSYSGVLRALGYNPSGGMHRYIRQMIRGLALDTSHFTGQGWARGRTDLTTARRPFSEILVKGSDYTSTSVLRKRLIAAGLKPAHCERCGIDTWLGVPVPLTLDHINGDPMDHRLENLRILCPNCHSLTDTWCRTARRTTPPA